MIKNLNLEETEDKNKVLTVEVQKTVNGITGNTLDMELSGEDGVDVDHLSDLFIDAVMTESEYDSLTEIWNQHESLTGILNALKKAGLIKDYDIKKDGSL